MKNKWTGERLETFIFNESTIEHLHRYAIAMELVVGKKVLDIACGEGYGSNLLAQKASFVTGMDSNKTAIQKAKEKYYKNNLLFTVSYAEKIEVPEYEFDIVVSFETLEHVQQHDVMIKEIRRVLKPGGLFLISTPEKKVYSDKKNYKNPFHVKELYRKELETLLNNTFPFWKIYNQQMNYSSFIYAEDSKELDIYSGNYTNIKKNDPSEPLYLIALASDSELPVLHNSLFTGASIVEQALAEREKMVTRTITYRLGHFLIYPLKIIVNLFKKLHRVS